MSFANEMNYKVTDNITEYIIYVETAYISKFARESIALANIANLITDRTINRFVADEQMTRSDVAIILMRPFDKKVVIENTYE